MQVTVEVTPILLQRIEELPKFLLIYFFPKTMNVNIISGKKNGSHLSSGDGIDYHRRT